MEEKQTIRNLGAGVRRLLYLVATTISFLLLFLYDVVAVVNRNILLLGEGWTSSLLFLAFISLFLFIRSRKRNDEFAPIRTLSRLLIESIAVLLTLLALLLMKEVFRGDAIQVNDPATIALFTFIKILASIVVFYLSIDTIQGLSTLILYKERHMIGRRFIVFLTLVVLMVILRAIPVEVPWAWIQDALIILTVLAGLSLVFRQSWIVFLSRKQKRLILIFTVLLFGAFGIVATLVDNSFNFEGTYAPLRTFYQSIMFFGLTYIGVSFVSTLFQLPTAEAFERKQAEVLSLQNLTRLVNQVLHFDELVRTVTGMTLEVCRANASWMELLTVDKASMIQSIRVAGLTKITAEEVERLVNQGPRNLRRDLYAQKEVLVIQDLLNDERTRYFSGMEKRFSTLACIPLLSKGELIGYLYASREIEYGFDQDDIKTLTTFADQVSISLENSRLITESLERRRLEQEISIAHEMQQRLLPKELQIAEKADIAAHSEMSTEVGGDYYDIIDLGDGKIGIVVADVSGKGISAAFYMAEVKGVFQSLARQGLSPRQFMIHANDALKGSLDTRSFVTLLYAIVDTWKGILTFSRAGHCPLIWTNKGKATLLRPQGIGLGLVDRSRFEESIEESSFVLSDGDLCLLYTDGVTESRNQLSEELSAERLADLVQGYGHLNAGEIRDKLVQEIRTFVNNSSTQDDLTFVVLKWRSTTLHRGGKWKNE